MHPDDQHYEEASAAALRAVRAQVEDLSASARHAHASARSARSAKHRAEFRAEADMYERMAGMIADALLDPSEPAPTPDVVA